MLLLAGALHAENQPLPNAEGVEAVAAVPVPAAVGRAAVRAVEVMPGAGAKGADVVIEWIEKPVHTAAELAAAAAAGAPPPELPAAQRAVAARAREEARAKAPAETRLFSPRVTAFAEGISLVEWAAWDGAGNFEDLAAWVRGPDLAGTIAAVGDLDVPLAGMGKSRRYLMAGVAVRDSAASSSTGAPVAEGETIPGRRGPQPPAAEEFGEAAAPGTGAAAVLMERGDGSNARLMEPLRALLAAYADPERAAKIAADAAALKAAQAAAAEAAARAAANPEPPEPQVIRFYTSQEDEIPALEQAARERKAAASAPADAAFPENPPALSPARVLTQ